MPSANITALTNYAGGQAPADLVYIGKSPFGAADDRKSTLNDLLSIITKNITDGALRFGQFAAPALSAANAGAIYFDNVSKTFQVSENGGAYVGLITLAAGSANEIQYNGGAGAFAANAAYTYDSTTNTVNIGAAGLTGKLKLTHTNTRALTIQPGVQSAARTFTWMTGYGNANQAVITDGFGNLSYGDFIPYPLPGVGDEVLYNAAGSLGASSQFQWNDAARILSFVTGALNAQIYFNTSLSTANIKFQSSAGIPGSQAGLIFPYIGGDQTSGHGLWWSDGTYLNTSRFNLQLGFNFQGAASSTSPLKIRKATGTSADGNIVFAFFPDSGFFDLQPFGVSAGETSALRFSELAANGTNYIEFKAPDALTANTTFTWPNGAGSAGQVLTTNGSNTLSWSTAGGGGLTIGTTAIASGTAGRILYETAGNLLGEIAGSSADANGAVQFAATARSSGVAQYFRINTPADTGQTASTESVGVYFGGNGSGATVTRTWAAGTVATQRENVFVGSTYAGASATATFTNVSNVFVTSPKVGTNAIVNNLYSGYFQGVKDQAITQTNFSPLVTDIQISAGTTTNAIGFSNGGTLSGGTITNALLGDNRLTLSGATITSAFGWSNITTFSSGSIATALTGFYNGVNVAQNLAGRIDGIYFYGDISKPITATINYGVRSETYSYGTATLGTNASNNYYSFYSKSYTASLPNWYHFYGDGNFPSYFGGFLGVNKSSAFGAQLHVVSGSASRVALRADSAANATVALNQFFLNTNVTNSVALHSVFSVDSSAGAGAAGLGGRLLFQLESSTTDDQDAAAINWLWTTATHASRTSAITFSVVNNAAALTEVFRIAPTALTLADAVDLVFNTTTGTKIATATGQKIGFWNASPVVQPTSAALTNNVTSGGTANTISDYSNLTVYATDAGTIRDNFYQLALKLKEISDALRLIGILG